MQQPYRVATPSGSRRIIETLQLEPNRVQVDFEKWSKTVGDAEEDRCRRGR